MLQVALYRYQENAMSTTAIHAFAAWLAERCAFLRNLEAEARRVLQDEKDTEKYRLLMRQKAMFLQALPEEGETFLANLPPAVAAETEERLDAFSRNASRALDIDSVFYMSALLYPDDHTEGQPNNLELFAGEMAALAAK